MLNATELPLQKYLHSLSRRLASVSDTPLLDAQVLVASILDKPRAWVLAHPEAGLTPEQQAALQAALERLEGGEPLPYVLGHREFYGLDFKITPDVLIPRPETELLVDRALAWLRRNPGRRLAVDIGTGSGCIAVALAVHVPDLQVAAVDISPAALQVAQENAARQQVEKRIHFVQSDLLIGLERRFDLICANLPYIPTAVLHELPVFGREPELALDGGPDGLDLIRRLFAQAPAHLLPEGLILMEIEATQGKIAQAAARQVFPEADIRISQDLAGKDRLISIQT